MNKPHFYRMLTAIFAVILAGLTLVIGVYAFNSGFQEAQDYQSTVAKIRSDTTPAALEQIKAEVLRRMPGILK